METLSTVVSVTIQSCITKFEDEVKKRNKFTAFVIELRTQTGLQWVVERRFSEFFKLNNDLKTRYEELKLFRFPKKQWFSSFATQTVEQRRRVLELYLQEILCLQPRPVELNTFLDINRHLGYGDAATDGGAAPNDQGGSPFGSAEVAHGAQPPQASAGPVGGVGDGRSDAAAGIGAGGTASSLQSVGDASLWAAANWRLAVSPRSAARAAARPLQRRTAALVPTRSHACVRAVWGWTSSCACSARAALARCSSCACCSRGRCSP